MNKHAVTCFKRCFAGDAEDSCRRRCRVILWYDIVLSRPYNIADRFIVPIATSL